MKMSLVQRLPCEMHLCKVLQMSHTCHCFWKWYKTIQNTHVWLIFKKVQNPMCLPPKATLERAKVVRTWCVFRILTSKRASCHNCVHFFGHLNFQKCFECEVFGMLTSKRASRQSGVCFFSISTSKSAPNVRCFFAFWFPNVLPATAVCTL